MNRKGKFYKIPLAKHQQKERLFFPNRNLNFIGVNPIGLNFKDIIYTFSRGLVDFSYSALKDVALSLRQHASCSKHHVGTFSGISSFTLSIFNFFLIPHIMNEENENEIFHHYFPNLSKDKYKLSSWLK